MRQGMPKGMCEWPQCVQPKRKGRGRVRYCSEHERTAAAAYKQRTRERKAKYRKRMKLDSQRREQAAARRVKVDARDTLAVRLLLGTA